MRYIPTILWTIAVLGVGYLILSGVGDFILAGSKHAGCVQ